MNDHYHPIDDPRTNPLADAPEFSGIGTGVIRDGRTTTSQLAESADAPDYVVQYLNADGVDQQGHEYSADVARIFTEPGDFVAEVERAGTTGRWRFSSGDPDDRDGDERYLYSDVDACVAALRERDEREWGAAHGVDPDRDSADHDYIGHLEREAGA